MEQIQSGNITTSIAPASSTDSHVNITSNINIELINFTNTRTSNSLNAANKPSSNQEMLQLLPLELLQYRWKVKIFLY